MKSKYYTLEKMSPLQRKSIILNEFLDTLDTIDHPHLPEEEYSKEFWRKLAITTARTLKLVLDEFDSLR